MGYTHYWYRPDEIDPITFNAIVHDFDVAYQKGHGSALLADGLGNGKPVINSKEIVFNGKGEEGSYETFDFPRVLPAEGYRATTDSNPKLIFQFTKTGERPYDVWVVAALIIAKHHLGKNIEVSSDGGNEDWKAGREIVQRTLGYGKDYELDETTGKLGLCAACLVKANKRMTQHRKRILKEASVASKADLKKLGLSRY